MNCISVISPIPQKQAQHSGKLPITVGPEQMIYVDTSVDRKHHATYQHKFLKQIDIKARRSRNSDI